ncbi:hypothetical protein [Candidatus Entotheonella palauensis]|uniref:hypothetical protein n=1 Tax=Candidatus Entotheonella palauensis TaxID=93172 RepID=UPI000B7F2307|nr:hypothetical protein [Candidatus Entotheonella palauensis]
MTDTYVHHRVTTEPLQWQAVAEALRQTGAQRLQAAGGALYGIWRSQIGRPRDELTVMTLWPEPSQASASADLLLQDVEAIRDCHNQPMQPTVRPQTTAPPRRQGNYAFRWFDTPAPNWQEFLDLCVAAWPGFESAYDSQVIGLWEFVESDDAMRRTLLLTRRPNLAMWERSKIPEGEAEAEVRRKLSRRYDLCDSTYVYTTTLLTADDQRDEVRWA